MRWLIDILPRWAFPGICITIFSLVALVLTIIPLPTDPKATKTKVLRFAVIVVAAVLCVLEITIIKKDRDDSMEQHVKDMTSILGKFTDLQATIQGLGETQTVIQQLPPHVDPLKRGALALSEQISKFLLSREVVPGFGQGPYGKGPYGGKPTDTEVYDRETIDAYLKAFEPQVRTTYEALERRGLTDPDLGKEYSNPVSTYSIRDTADRLTTLASALPD
jgi:hypothetical protein